MPLQMQGLIVRSIALPHPDCELRSQTEGQQCCSHPKVGFFPMTAPLWRTHFHNHSLKCSMQMTRRHNYRPWHVLCQNDWQPASVKEGAENCQSSKTTCHSESCLTAGEASLKTAATTVVPLDHTPIKEIWFGREGSNIEVLMLWGTKNHSSLYGSTLPDHRLS